MYSLFKNSDLQLNLDTSSCAPAFKFEGFEANDGIYFMQNDRYNGDVYYKRETPSVRYALRGYNNNWHFPTEVSSVASSSGWKPAGDECPYTTNTFRYSNQGVIDGVTVSGIFISFYRFLTCLFSPFQLRLRLQV